jgi:hypothetical protein
MKPSLQGQQQHHENGVHQRYDFISFSFYDRSAIRINSNGKWETGMEMELELYFLSELRYVLFACTVAYCSTTTI